jgi:hypothetical protein
MTFTGSGPLRSDDLSGPVPPDDAVASSHPCTFLGGEAALHLNFALRVSGQFEKLP